MFRFFRLIVPIALMLAALPLHAAEGGVTWLTDFEAAKAAAVKEKKLIFMDIYADWCPPCKMLDKDTFPAPEVQKLLGEFIPVKIDADKQGEIVEKYSDGSLPTLAVIDEKGRLLDSTAGFLDAPSFVEWLQTARKSGEQLAKLEATVADNPTDAASGLALANQYIRIREGGKALGILQAIPSESVAKLPEADQAQFLYTRGMAEFEAETFFDGVATLKDFAAKFPNDPRAADIGQYILQGNYLGARKAFKDGDLKRAREAFAELATNTNIPGAAETAQMELTRIDMFGKPAPALQVTDWLVGDAVDLAKLKGKVVLIDFFQIADPGTETSRPAVAELHAKHAAAGLEVVSIAVAFDMLEEQTPEKIGAFVGQHEYGYPVGIDNELTKTFLAYSGMGSPWSAIVDKDGNIAYLDFYDLDRVPAKIAELLSK